MIVLFFTIFAVIFASFLLYSIIYVLKTKYV